MGSQKFRMMKRAWVIAGLSASAIALTACGGTSESTGDQDIRQAAEASAQSLPSLLPSTSATASGIPPTAGSDAASPASQNPVPATSPATDEGDSPTGETSDGLALATGYGCASATYRCVSLNFTNQFQKIIYVSVDGGEMGRQEAYITPGSSHQFVGYDGHWTSRDVRGDLFLCRYEDDEQRGRCGSPDNRPSYVDEFNARNPQIGKPSFGFALGANGERDTPPTT